MQRIKSYVGISSTAVFALLAASACSSVSDVTRERVSRSDAAVQQAQQAVGNQEAGAIELQRAKNNLETAKRAIDQKNETNAQRYAHAAQLDAELAVAKTQSAASRKAANELLASIQQLQQETQRQPGQPATAPASQPATSTEPASSEPAPRTP